MMAVGVHIDSHVIAAVRIDGSLRNPEITRFVAESMPRPAADNPHHLYEFRAKVLEDFLRRHKLPRENVFLAFDSEFCLHRLITVPFTADDQIKKTIRFQAEAHIHTANIDDVEMTFRKLIQRSNSSDVMVNIIRRNPLRESLGALHHEGVDPWGVDTPFAAGANAILFHPDAKLEEPVLWVDVGVASTMVALTNSGELIGLRLPKVGLEVPREADVEQQMAKAAGPVVPRGANGNGNGNGPAAVATASPEALAAYARNVAFEAEPGGEMALPEWLDEEAAPEWLKEGGSPEASSPPLVLSEHMVLERPDALVRRFVTELKRTLVSMTTEVQPTKLKLSGGGEASTLLAAAVREAMPGMEVEEVDAGFGLRVKDEARPLVEARNQGLLKPLGMALKGFGHNPLGFEFRRGEFAVQDAFEAVQAPLTVAVMLLALLFGAVLVFVNGNQSRIDHLEQSVYDRAAAAYKDAYDDEPPETVEEIYERLHADFSDIEQVSRRGEDLPPTRNALDVWIRIQDAIERVGREPTGEHRRVEGYERGIWPFREDSEFQWRPEHEELLELEWTVQSIDISDTSVVIRGRFAKVDGLNRLQNELEEMTDLFELDPTGRRANIDLDTRNLREAGELNHRGEVQDHRGTWTLRAPLQRPY